jgi:fructose/tagatose bisphosphate aldolase
MKIKPKYFIGPMTKNVVDSIIKFCNETGNEIGLIPSRRQIEWDGGYVNNWKTSDFSEYVSKGNAEILLQRDHSGPGQGKIEDFGYRSLLEDCGNLDLIHIDPWKKYPNYKEGLEWTVDMIKYCDSISKHLEYEVGTEESIRRFESYEIDQLLKDLSSELGPELFSKIKYAVIQSGTSLKGNNQTGQYDKNRLMEMVSVVKKYNLLSKEHNGDYIPVSTIREKFALGLDSINIAPEFGLIETQTYLDEIKDPNLFQSFWKICYESKKWEKWVNSDFDPFVNKEELIKICGHYVLSNPVFLSEIKSNFPGIDERIQINITEKLKKLYE